jgi:hypothetical protein
MMENMPVNMVILPATIGMFTAYRGDMWRE